MSRERRRPPIGTYPHYINKGRKEGEEVLTSLWDFGDTIPQKERRHVSSDAFAARMRPPLARALLQLYGEEPILDPMCGSGTTCITAALLGMESYGIDIEEENIELCKKQIPQLRGATVLSKSLGAGDLHRGRIKTPSFKQGDARQLTFPDQFFGGIVFSPPYWNAIGKSQSVRDEVGSPYIQSKGSGKTWRARNNPYGFTEGNVGNIRNYIQFLRSMGEIFTEISRVTRHGCFCCCVVKDVQRKFRLVPLHADLIRVGCEAGFELYDMIINKMYHQAHWMVHHAMNEQFDMGMPRSFRVHEFILIFIKPE